MSKFKNLRVYWRISNNPNLSRYDLKDRTFCLPKKSFQFERHLTAHFFSSIILVFTMFF